MRVLFVDDKKDPAAFVDGPCDVARTAAEAVRLLRTHRYDVLYLDYYLHDRPSGPKGTDVLRHAGMHGTVPAKVIGVSSDPVKNEELEALARTIHEALTLQRPKPMTESILQFFRYDHLPITLQQVSAPFAQLAQKLVDTVPRNPERTVALRKLLEAKDAAVRATLYEEPKPDATT